MTLRLILPDGHRRRRECIHKPGVPGFRDRSRGPTYRTLKQVLCQPAGEPRSIVENPFISTSYQEMAGSSRYRHMSSRCRRFRTEFQTAAAKLLIAGRCATVAQSRQMTGISSPSNNNRTQHNFGAACGCCAKTSSDPPRPFAVGTESLFRSFFQAERVSFRRLRVTRSRQAFAASKFI